MKAPLGLIMKKIYFIEKLKISDNKKIIKFSFTILDSSLINLITIFQNIQKNFLNFFPFIKVLADPKGPASKNFYPH